MNLGFGGRQDGILLRLALFIEPVQVPGQFPGLAAILGQEQFQRRPGLAQATGGVEPGRQFEGHISERNRAVSQAGHFFEGLDAGTPAGCQDIQAAAHQDTVHAGEGGDVGGRAQGHQIQIVFDIGLGTVNEPTLIPEAGPEAQHQVKGHAHPGQLFKGIAAIGALGVDHGQSRRQFRGRFMMIGNDDLETEGPGLGYFCSITNATVNGHQEIGFAGQFRQGRGMQSIPLGQPVGDVADDPGPQAFQKMPEEGSGGESVDVVIAVDDDGLLRVTAWARRAAAAARSCKPAGSSSRLRVGSRKEMIS